MSVLVLNEREVRGLLSMPECIRVMRGAFASLRDGALQAPRLPVWQPDGRGCVAAMPAYVSDPPAIGAKVITVFPQNRAAGLESHQGVVALYDAQTGALLSLMHAGAITEIRTAAVSAVATDLLAPRDASTLALLGSGVQAHSHLEAMLCVRDIREVRVWSRTPEHAHEFAGVAGASHPVEIAAAESARDAVADCGIVCTLTPAREPILAGAWLRRGAHLNAVGASVPGFRELDAETVAAARLFVELRDVALREADDVRVPIANGVFGEDHIAGDLGELVRGEVPARTRQDQTTVFESVGMAIEDVAAARFIYAAAVERGAGTPVDL